jgi:hypothetical protein
LPLLELTLLQISVTAPAGVGGVGGGGRRLAKPRPTNFDRLRSDVLLLVGGVGGVGGGGRRLAGVGGVGGGRSTLSTKVR